MRTCDGLFQNRGQTLFFNCLSPVLHNPDSKHIGNNLKHFFPHTELNFNISKTITKITELLIEHNNYSISNPLT